MKVGLIGLGRWGQNIHRSLTQLGCEVAVSDPAFNTVTPGELMDTVGRVVIATPPETHSELALLAVEHGTPFYCEKPLALFPDIAAEIAAVANAADVQGAVSALAVHTKGARRPRKTLRAYRFGSAPGYHGINAWWDYGIHDVTFAVHHWGPPDTISGNVGLHDSTFVVHHRTGAKVDVDSYQVTADWSDGRRAEFTGDRASNYKKWEIWSDGKLWTPYRGEPLARQLKWWLKGGNNLDVAVTAVETLSSVAGARMGAGVWS